MYTKFYDNRLRGLLVNESLLLLLDRYIFELYCKNFFGVCVKNINFYEREEFSNINSEICTNYGKTYAVLLRGGNGIK